MTIFKYSAYDSNGAKFEGDLEAIDQQQAKHKLISQNLLVVSIREVNNDSSSSFFSSTSNKVSLKNLEFIISELAILIKSGVRIDKGLEILRKGVPDIASRTMLQSLAQAVKSGKSVADSFALHPEVFNPLFINMIRLGEATGNLDDIFLKLSLELKFRRDLQSKIVQALTYPLIILCVCIGCILFVFNYIVPQMSGIFQRNEDLPVYTEILLGLSDWFIQYQWYLAIFLILGSVFFMRSLKHERFHTAVDEFGLKLPLIGRGILLVERIRFNSSMSMMLSSGVPLVDAMTLSNGSVKNHQIAGMLNVGKNRVKQGAKLSEVLKNIPFYSDFNVSLIEVGEESGELEPVFEEIAQRSRQDFESWTKTLTSMIEPVLILVMGGIVGSVVVVMLLSIVSTNDIGL